jgi:hypothetical protein
MNSYQIGFGGVTPAAQETFVKDARKNVHLLLKVSIVPA